MFKKALSILLSVLLIISSMPITALANMESTKNNTAEKNQEILNDIPLINKDSTSKEDMLIQLQNLGLLDGEGELVTTASIDVDIDGDGVSESMTLDKIRAMLEEPNVDFTQTVSVDGTSLTLGNLKTMIEIENEIARIRSEYLDLDVTITEDHENEKIIGTGTLIEQNNYNL